MMKKLLAIALALMLLMTAAAFAEPANVLTLSNANLLVSGPDGSYIADLTGLTATLALGSPEGVPTLQLDLTGDGQALLGAEIQFIDGNMVLNIDGMSRPIAASLNNADAQESLEQLFASLDSMSEFKLPPFTGVNIPKLDLMSVADILPMLGVQTATEGQATTFEVPAELIRQLSQTLLASIPDETKAQLGGIDQLLANANFSLKGKISDDGDTAEMLIEMVPQTDRGNALSDAGSLYFVSSENSDSLELTINADGQSVTLGRFDLTSDPAAATLDVGLDLMGQITLNFSLYPQDGAQVAALALKADQESLNASLTYGEADGQEFTQLAFELPGEDVSASVDIVESPAADGGKAGSMSVDVSANGQTVNLSTDLTEGKGEADFRPIANAAQAYDANNMSEADNQAMASELDGLLTPLMEYMNGVSIQPAA